MKDDDLGRKIAGQLNHGVKAIDPGALARLQAARRAALAKYAEPKPAFGLAFAGGGRSRSGFAGQTWWLPALMLVLGLLGVGYWQQSQRGGDDGGDVDAALLASDLPLHAYLDGGLDKWLKRSSQ